MTSKGKHAVRQMAIPGQRQLWKIIIIGLLGDGNAGVKIHTLHSLVNFCSVVSYQT